MSQQTRDIIHVKHEEYDILNVNGAWVGVTPRGDLLIQFFYEYIDIPDSVTIQFSQQGVKEISREPTPQVTYRDFKIGVTMNANQAEAFAKSVLKRVQRIKDRNEKGKGSDQTLYT
jgi:hypothetical protein